MSFPELQDSILRSVERLVLLVYYRQYLSGDWGHMGENAQQVSLCYAMMGLSPNQKITDRLVADYFEKLDGCLRLHQIVEMTLGQIDDELKSYSFFWQGKLYSIEELDELSADLRAAGYDLLLQGGYYGKTLELICGRGTEQSFESLRVTTIFEEHFRTSTILLPIAAMISYQHIFVRMVALKSIFYQKWEPFLISDDGITLTGTLGERLGIQIRRLANLAYGGDLISQEALFVADIRENVLYHELGHAVIQHHLLDLKTATIGEGVKMLGEQILIDLLEVLADIAPHKGELSGPLYRMTLLSRSEPVVAERLMWTYVSDAWFFDTPDTYMYGYSTYFSLIVMGAISKDGIDFERLERILETVLPLILRYTVDIASFLDHFVTDLEYSVESQSCTKADFLSREYLMSPPPQKFSDIPYMRLSWEYSKCLEYAQEHESTKFFVMDRLNSFRHQFEAEFMATLGYPYSQDLALSEQVMMMLDKQLGLLSAY